jgi:ferredoxin-type protein NapG
MARVTTDQQTAQPSRPTPRRLPPARPPTRRSRSSRGTTSDRHALFIPTVHSDACTGCGKCERSCVLEEAAIKVLPLKQAKGRIGRHYRLGWEEKKMAGGALIPEPLQLPVRRPDGQ